MAALAESDLIKILGPDFRLIEAADQKSKGVEAEEREARAKIESLEDGKFPAWVTIFVGLALLISTWFTVTGREFMIQTIIGAVILAAGIAILIRIGVKLTEFRALAAQLHQATSSR